MSLLEDIAGVAAELAGGEADNTWWLTCPDDERADLPAAAVVQSFETCAAAASARRHPGVFYVWHDQLAGQLRCAVTSQPSEQLGFGATVRPSPLVRIVEEFIQGSAVIHWESLTEAGDDADDSDDDREWTVEVWRSDLR